MLRSALIAGSFDPITNGHLNIISRAAGMYDSITVGVLVNDKKHSLFSIDERMDIVRHVTGDLPNVKVDSFSGLLADYVNEHRFDAVVRGLRATTDFEYEIQMAQMNARLYRHGTETVFLMADPSFSFISSSLIKEVASYGGDIRGLVPEYVRERLQDKIELRGTER